MKRYKYELVKRMTDLEDIAAWLVIWAVPVGTLTVMLKGNRPLDFGKEVFEPVFHTGTTPVLNKTFLPLFLTKTCHIKLGTAVRVSAKDVLYASMPVSFVFLVRFLVLLRPIFSGRNPLAGSNERLRKRSHVSPNARAYSDSNIGDQVGRDQTAPQSRFFEEFFDFLARIHFGLVLS